MNRKNLWVFGGSTWKSCAILLAGAGLLGASLTAPALAVNPQYVLIDLGRLNEFTDDEVIVFGMNNLGECVGMVRHSDSSDLEAFVWLPNDNYEDKGLYSIETITGMGVVNGGSSTNGTVAYDINDAGIAVGRCWVSNLDAMVWDLTGAENPYPILVGINNVFNALSINNDNPPLIVGGSVQLFAWEGLNTGFTSGNFSISSGFYHVFDSTAAYLPVTNNQSRTGFGIADTVNSNALVAGFMVCDSANDPYCGASGECNDDFNGAAWAHVTSTADQLEPLDYVSGESMLVLGHAASNDGFVVGFGRLPVDEFTLCRQRPIFWSDPTDPYVAPVILPPLNSEAQHFELALDIMNSQGNGIDVVGRNTTLGVALRWRSNIYNTD